MTEIFKMKTLSLKGENNWVYITYPLWRIWLIQKLIGLRHHPHIGDTQQ